MADLVYKERIDSESPTTATFALDGGKSTSIWVLQNGSGGGGAITATDLQGAITQIVGGTRYASGDGRLQRTPPLADPLYPWLFADQETHRGKGTFAKIDAQASLDVPPLPNAALYSNYEFTISFTPRQYPIVTDANITKTSSSWYNFKGTSQSLSYVTEYERYVDYVLSPLNNNITAQIGAMAFNCTGDANGKTFVGSPRMYLPDSAMKVIWYGVPYRYVISNNSYLDAFKGCINQTDFVLLGKNFPAGSLLYLNYNPVKYTPPVQQLSAIIPGVFASDKLCNLELNFLYTTRKATNNTTAPTNHNFIQAGWNAQPWLVDRNFYYAVSTPNATLFPSTVSTPSWYSFPAQLLFFDCDTTGAYDVTQVNA